MDPQSDPPSATELTSAASSLSTVHQIDWQRAGQAWEYAPNIISNFRGASFCDTEVYGEYIEETDSYGPGGVPRERFVRFLEGLKLALYGLEWTSTTPTNKRLQNGLGEVAASVLNYCTARGDRLETWAPDPLVDAGDLEGDNVALLQTAEGHVLIVGIACMHPFVACDEFSFGNSDGSTHPVEFDEGSASALLQSMCRIAENYVYEQSH